MRRFWIVAALVLALLMLSMTPTAAQNPDSQFPELYAPLIGASRSFDQMTQEQPVTAAHSAAAPDAVPALLRHEPGHLSKVKDLDVRLAAGEINDPLGPNTTLVTWDKIAVVYKNTSNAFTHMSLDVPANLGKPWLKERVSGAGVAGGHNMDIAAGYFTGAAGWIDTAAAWENTSGTISLYAESYNSSLLKSTDATVNTADVVAGENTTGWPWYGALIREATGEFDGDGYDEFVVAWEGTSASLNLRVWDTVGSITPTAKGTIAGETLGGYKFLDVATGDFNGDGKDEIAIAWQGSDSKLAVKVYSVGSTGNLVAQGKLVDTATTPGSLAITTGDFDGNAKDEIVVAYNTETTVGIFVYQVSTDLKTLTKKGTASASSGKGYDPLWEKVARQLALQAGDFSADGVDELALVYGAPGQPFCNVSVYATDVLTPALRATKYLDQWDCYGALSMAVGDMNRDAIDEIVVGNIDLETMFPSVELGLYQVAPDLGTIAEKQHYFDIEYVGGAPVHMALTVGAFDGKSVRVGPPTYSQMSETLQLLAVINAPPKHRDEVNGVAYDINVTDPAQCIPGPCTYATYKTVQNTSTSMSLATTRDWSVSNELNLKIPFVEASMSASYGESFEKTTTAFASQEFGQDVIADADDAIVRIEQSLNIWEYPVYADGSDVIQGHILVVWPDKADPTCTSNCSAAITTVITGKNPTSTYLPNHEIFDVMSYPIMAPTDISTTVKSDTKNDLGANGYHWWVKWEDIQTDATKQSNKLDLGASLTVSAFGQSLTTSGSYSQGDTTVNEISFKTSTELHLYYWGIDGTYSYGVRPFIYFAKPDGHLVLDYQVTPLTATPDTWWETTYNKPDPTFNLPWKISTMPEAYKQLSREITFDPRSAAPGDIVAITAKVRNYSLVGANNVKVRFFLGDPDAGGTKIGETTIATLNPMASVPTTIQYNTTGKTAGTTLDIYAVVDPDKTLAEVHEDYNKAYAQLPIVSPPSAPGEPKTLFVSADDIVLDPPTPAAGDTVHISATIHAAHNTFTWVAVEFWDGNPRAGGTSIGGRLIPLIEAGGEATVSVDWPVPGGSGQSELCVTIMRHPGDQNVQDNRASITVQLEPYRVNFPVTLR